MSKKGENCETDIGQTYLQIIFERFLGIPNRPILYQ